MIAHYSRRSLASPAYAHDYASPFDAAVVVTEPAVHGRWWRSSIHPELFMPWTASGAESLMECAVRADLIGFAVWPRSTRTPAVTKRHQIGHILRRRRVLSSADPDIG
jgi:hypothetical protein